MNRHPLAYLLTLAVVSLIVISIIAEGEFWIFVAVLALAVAAYALFGKLSVVLSSNNAQTQIGQALAVQQAAEAAYEDELASIRSRFADYPELANERRLEAARRRSDKISRAQQCESLAGAIRDKRTAMAKIIAPVMAVFVFFFPIPGIICVAAYVVARFSLSNNI
jgi:hypothetical protein